jgi:hypothetical protein
VSLGQLLQFYAPLAGLLVTTFWLGVLSARVSTLEREERDRKDREPLEQTDHDTLVLLSGDMSAVKETLKAMARNYEGVQRQLATLSSGKRLEEYRAGETT